MTVFPRIPVPSALSNLPHPHEVSEALHSPSGFWFGFSHYQSSEQFIRVAHKACWDGPKPFRTDSSQVISAQSVYVLAYCCGEKAGSARFKPYNVEDGGLVDPGVWASSTTRVLEKWRRQGVAKAIYSHMRAFGYTLSPASVLSDYAMLMWKGFDTSISFKTSWPDKNEIVNSSPIELPLLADWDQEAERIRKHYAEFREPDFVEYTKRFVLNLQYGANDVLRLTNVLAEYFRDPVQALAELIAECQYVRDVADIDILRNPDAYGENSFPKMKLIRYISPASRKCQRELTENLFNVAMPISKRYWSEWDAEKNRFGDEFRKWIECDIPENFWIDD